MSFNRLIPKILFTLVSLFIIFLVIFLTYQRVLKQDDGWYASYVFKWMQKIGNTTIHSYWDYTDANDLDLGCSFVLTLIQGTFFSIFGVSVISMKALNSIEAIILCGLLYAYMGKENKAWAMGAVLLMICWNMVNIHFFNRPELPASILALVILNLLNYHSGSRRSVFFAYLITGLMLDLHPLSLFVVAAICVKFFIQNKDMRWMAAAGWAAGILVYFVGNFLVNGSYGIFTGIITGVKMSPGDHYIPVIHTGIADMRRIMAERFTFITKIVGVSGYLKAASFLVILITAVYLRLTKKLVKSVPLQNSLITYVVFILLSTLFSEAVSNGFRLYHAIVFGLLYFSLVYAIYCSLNKKIRPLAFIGCIPFILFTKDTVYKTRESYAYHKQNHYYRTFSRFNEKLPDTGKVLMRPTHAFFNYRKHIRFDYTYGLLRYMYKEHLSFKDAVVKKGYDHMALDEQFETEFFTDRPSPYRQDPSPYYYPLRQTGLTSHEFKQLVTDGFLVPVDTLNDAFAGRTVLYKVNNSQL